MSEIFSTASAVLILFAVVLCALGLVRALFQRVQRNRRNIIHLRQRRKSHMI